MKRFYVALLVGFLFTVPSKSWAAPPLPTMSLQERVVALEAEVASLKAFLTKLQTYMTVDTTNNRITFTGVNLQLVDGTGETYPAAPNGYGNFIIGYDKEGVPPTCGGPPAVKTGSHNLVIGDYHTYSSSGGFVAGFWSKITAKSATVIGGENNIASGDVSTVSGGFNNVASGIFSVVSGGGGNIASGIASTVSGSTGLHASEEWSYLPYPY